tara:strand:+ start:278 stop:568 length:291 start_codon:yes stop_codon:yes gene_type:complete
LYPIKEPIICPNIKYGIDLGDIPVKVSEKTLAIVTAGLAKDVDEVNQYPAVINNATPIATEFSSLFLINNIVKISPQVANISLTNRGNSPLILDEI